MKPFANHPIKGWLVYGSLLLVYGSLLLDTFYALIVITKKGEKRDHPKGGEGLGDLGMGEINIDYEMLNDEGRIGGLGEWETGRLGD